jgi:hypothetical protein
MCAGEGIIGGLVVVDLEGNETVEDERCHSCGGSGVVTTPTATAPGAGPPPLRSAPGASHRRANDELNRRTQKARQRAFRRLKARHRNEYADLLAQERRAER